MADDLFSIKNEFYLGNYQGAINEAQSSDLELSSPNDERDRDVIVYRSYIALGEFDVVQSEIGEDAQTALQAVKLLATYLSGEENKEIAMVTLKEWLSDPQTQNNPTLQLVAGIIYIDRNDLEEAAKVSLQVQVYIRMARVDIAEKSLALMSRMEDDATLTQLTTAWVNLALGGEKVQEAFYIFQELADKYNETPLLLNGMAAAQMHMQKFEEAEKYLLKALQKSSSDTQAPEVVNRYLSSLGRAAPSCSLISRRAKMEKEFDAAVGGFKPSA